MLLRNKVGLVTGGGDGIGRGTCQALAEQGARVVVSDVNAESGGETAELIRQAGGGGAIVNISSMAGYKGMALQAAYSASKGGVIALTKTAASEYAQQGIRVNAICPGGVRTAGLQIFLDTMPGLDETVARVHAMGRLGEVREIADAVVFLCSDQSSFMTGHIMPIEGGALVKSL